MNATVLVNSTDPAAASAPDLGTRGVAHTGPDGSFAVEVFQPGPYALTASAPGLAAAFLPGVVLPTNVPVTLRMASGGATLSGSVRAEGGGAQPAHPRVRVYRISDDNGDVFGPEVSGAGFRITLPPGSYVVLADEVDRTGTTTVKLESSLTQDVVIDLPLAKQPAAPEVVVDWIRSHAIPLKTVEAGNGFEDLAPLRAVVGTARVVSLGEATHGTREFFQAKHRLLEFLATEMGFNVFAIEASWPETLALDDYLRTGQGDPAALVARMRFWTWDTQEVLEMVRWMRRFNADPRHRTKLRFLGFDMQFSPVAAQALTAYLAHVDPGLQGDVRRSLALLDGEYAASRYSRRPADVRKRAEADLRRILQAFDEERSVWERRSSARSWTVARQEAVVLAQAEHGMSNSDFAFRDRAMAENLLWLLATSGPGAKVVAWAHNGHVLTGTAGNTRPMGSHLKADLGADLLTLVFAFNEGSFQAIDGGPSHELRSFTVPPAPPGSLDATLARAGIPRLVLDLRDLPREGPVAAWFSGAHGTRSVGAVFSEAGADNFLASTRAPSTSDAILFVARTTRAQPQPTGRRPARGQPLAAPINGGFEEGPPGQVPTSWESPTARPGDRYRTRTVTKGCHGGAQCVEVSSSVAPGPIPGYGTVFQRVDAASWRGKRMRVSAWVAVHAGASGRAYLFAEARGAGAFVPSAVVDTWDPPLADPHWTRQELLLDIPADAFSVTLGLALDGTGTALLDDVEVTVEALPAGSPH